MRTVQLKPEELEISFSGTVRSKVGECSVREQKFLKNEKRIPRTNKKKPLRVQLAD